MQFKTDTLNSIKDIRDITSEQALADPTYPPEEHGKKYTYHLNQKSLGVCTAISICTVLKKMYGRNFSFRFLYSLGKKLIDKNTTEGSSARTMLKIANKYGVLPLPDGVQEDDVNMSHQEFLNVTYSDAEMALAANFKLSYAQARLDPVGFAKDLYNSKYGIITRQAVGDNTYRPSWAKKDLELLRKPNPVTGGHLVLVTWYQGLDENQLREWHNTWGDKNNPTSSTGAVWSDDGNLKYRYSDQKDYVTEAWIILDYQETPFVKHHFTKPIKYGTRSTEVSALQRTLIKLGFLTIPSSTVLGYYGELTRKAVFAFQKAHNVGTPFEINSLRGAFVGKKTIAKLNEVV